MKRYQDLHWYWPYESRLWGKNDQIETTPVKAKTKSGDICIDFQDAADLTTQGYIGRAVIAPISGVVTKIEPHKESGGFTVEIVTYLDPRDSNPNLAGDGSTISNKFVGVSSLNPKLEEGYELVQGEWIGHSVESSFAADWPQWVCWVRLLDEEKGSYVYASDFAEKECAGIDWKSESTEDEWADMDVYEQGPPMPEQYKARPKQSQTGMILLGAAVAAFLLFGKKN
jgi:hypothetical protein